MLDFYLLMLTKFTTWPIFILFIDLLIRLLTYLFIIKYPY